MTPRRQIQIARCESSKILAAKWWLWFVAWQIITIVCFGTNHFNFDLNWVENLLCEFSSMN